MTEQQPKEIRFAVGSRNGPRSTIWKCWVHGSETYILSRMFGRESKVSLHSSGECQWSMTDSWVLRQPVPKNSERHMVRWKIDYSMSSEATLAFRIAIPETELRCLPLEGAKRVFWVGNVPSGYTVQFLFFITMPSDVPPPTEHERFKHLVSMRLSNGRWVAIFADLISLSISDIHEARDAAIKQAADAGIEVLSHHRIALFTKGGEGSCNGLIEVCPPAS